MILILLLFGIAGNASAQLSAEDVSTLTDAFDYLSHGWDGQIVNDANQVLGRDDVDVDDLVTFFDGYFETRPFTDDLARYLTYPSFSWFGDAVSAKLQLATARSLSTLLARLAEAHDGYEGSLLSVDSVRTSVRNIHYHMNRLFNDGVSEQAIDETFQFYQDHFARYPALAKTHTIDTDLHPHFGAVRGQIYMNLRDAAWKWPDLNDLFIELIGLNDAALEQYLHIWNEHRVLVIDNNQADSTQLTVIDRMLSLIPPSLHDLGTIRMRDFLGQGAMSFKFRQNHGVNVFIYRVGTRSENAFPHDIDPLPTDLFTTVLAHEINHVVDAFTIGGDAELDERRDQLISDAGSFSYNYLRSHVESGFFQKAPQEFFASISNQYFSSSDHTFDLALSRLQRGYRHPMNQFLFFADIYSQGTDSTYFYSFDTSGELNRRTVRLHRDAAGHIAEIEIAAGEVYRFKLDDEGKVTGYEPAGTLTSRENSALPTSLVLKQNYPNPFNPVTTITFTLPVAGRVSLEVIDLLGRRVALLVSNEWYSPGTFEFPFNAEQLPSGPYIYRLTTDAQSLTREMMLVK